jgi:polyhydroxyalkanoate synthesis repressor PhaR
VSDQTAAGGDPVIIKKYANRRLYNTAASTYVTLEDLAEMVREEVDFLVYDAKSGEDITRSVLTQIIFEQEAKGQNLLPAQFLRQLIRFYDDSMQALVPRFLEMSLESLTREQEKLRAQMVQAIGGDPLDAMEKQVQKNLAMFQEAMSMFAPFGTGSTAPEPTGGDKSASPAKSESADAPEDIDALREQLASLQTKLDSLAKTVK